MKDFEPIEGKTSMGSWADNYVRQLAEGKTVQFRPRGNSMKGKIDSGQLVTVEPRPAGMHPAVGSIVLCKVNGHQYVHIVKAVDSVNEQVQIMNNKGHVNGWTHVRNIYGAVTKVED